MLTHNMITHIHIFLLHYKPGGLTLIISVHICRWMRNNEMMWWEGAPDTDVCFIMRVLYAVFTNSSCFMRNIKRHKLIFCLNPRLNPMYFWTNIGYSPSRLIHRLGSITSSGISAPLQTHGHLCFAATATRQHTRPAPFTRIYQSY